MSIAKSVVTGTVYRAPEKRFTQNNIAVSDFVLDIGDKEQMFIRVVSRRTALDDIVSSLNKGDRILVEGRLQTNSAKMDDGSDSKRREKITDDIIGLLTGSLNISPVDLKGDTNLVEELAIDSMQLYEFVVDLEESYNIRLPDELLEQIVTVNDIVDLVMKLTSE